MPSKLVFLAAGVSAADSLYTWGGSSKAGCACSAACDTSITFNCDAALYCKVPSSCSDASESWFGTKYDECAYDPDVAYESKSAAEKASLVMSRVLDDTTSGEYPSTTGLLKLFTASVRLSFEASADVFPMARTKFIHSVGTVAGIKFTSNGKHKYTGLFTGVEHGLIRASSAAKPSKSGYTPGVAVKFFRDGRPSANFVAMPSLDAQQCSDSNFFHKSTFWNHVAAPAGNFALKLVAKKFWQASYCPLMVGLSDLASPAEGQDGTFPFQITLQPAQDLDVEIPCDNYAQGLQNFEALKNGQKLFDVYAIEAPGAQPELIGNIDLTSQFSQSQFGDSTLFFKHQKMEDDFKKKPEWLDSIDKLNDCGMAVASTKPPAPEDGCHAPFAPKTLVV